jgi:hypothetical protein
MRLNTKMAPDTVHARPTNGQLFGKPIAAPVGRTISGTLTRDLQDTRLGRSCPLGVDYRDNANRVLPNAPLESASSTSGYIRHCNAVAAELPGKNYPLLTSK